MNRLAPFKPAIIASKLGSVTLREVKPADAEPLNKIFVTPSVNKYLLTPPSNVNGSLGEIIAETRRGHKSIVAISSGRIVGRISIRPKSGRASHVTDFGIMFSPEVQGKGVATACVTELFQYLRANGFKLIESSVFADNARGRGFYRKLGFKEVGIIQDGIIRNGKPIDHVIITKDLAK